VAALRSELARAEPDQAAAQEEAQYVRTSCAACHDRFREGDATAGFRFKPGVID
jgi:cytochrome c553